MAEVSRNGPSLAERREALPEISVDTFSATLPASSNLTFILLLKSIERNKHGPSESWYHEAGWDNHYRVEEETMKKCIPKNTEDTAVKDWYATIEYLFFLAAKRPFYRVKELQIVERDMDFKLITVTTSKGNKSQVGKKLWRHQYFNKEMSSLLKGGLEMALKKELCFLAICKHTQDIHFDIITKIQSISIADFIHRDNVTDAIDEDGSISKDFIATISRSDRGVPTVGDGMVILGALFMYMAIDTFYHRRGDQATTRPCFELTILVWFLHTHYKITLHEAYFHGVYSQHLSAGCSVNHHFFNACELIFTKKCTDVKGEKGAMELICICSQIFLKSYTDFITGNFRESDSKGHRLLMMVANGCFQKVKLGYDLKLVSDYKEVTMSAFTFAVYTINDSPYPSLRYKDLSEKIGPMTNEDILYKKQCPKKRSAAEDPEPERAESGDE
jgi:hypothetical protein